MPAAPSFRRQACSISPSTAARTPSATTSIRRPPLLWVLRDTLGLGRYEIRLRCRPVQRVHGAFERRTHPVLPSAGVRRGRPAGHDDRGSGAARRSADGRATGLDRGTSRSAATAKPGRSCARRRCSHALRSRPTPRSTRICRRTSAVAGRIRAFARRSTAPRRRSRRPEVRDERLSTRVHAEAVSAERAAEAAQLSPAVASSSSRASRAAVSCSQCRSVRCQESPGATERCAGVQRESVRAGSAGRQDRPVREESRGWPRRENLATPSSSPKSSMRIGPKSRCGSPSHRRGTSMARSSRAVHVDPDEFRRTTACRRDRARDARRSRRQNLERARGRARHREQRRAACGQQP